MSSSPWSARPSRSSDAADSEIAEPRPAKAAHVRRRAVLLDESRDRRIVTEIAPEPCGLQVGIERIGAQVVIVGRRRHGASAAGLRRGIGDATVRRLGHREPSRRPGRVGRKFAAGDGKPECIVSGGLGTSTVTYKGKQYYVCCSGCRDAFNENPEKFIKELEAKQKEK